MVSKPVKVEVMPAGAVPDNEVPGRPASHVHPMEPLSQALLIRKSNDFSSRALAVRVADKDSRLMAGELYKDGKALVSMIKEFFAPLKANAHASWKGLCDAETVKLAEIKPALDALGGAILSFDSKAERERQAAIHEAQRIEDEARILADKALKKVEALEKNGDNEGAARVANEGQIKIDAVLAKAPEVPEAVKTEGLGQRDHWTFEVIDAKLIPREYLMPDEVKIGRTVRNMKGDASIAGVRVFNKPILV
jgi:hypothetical protein